MIVGSGRLASMLVTVLKENQQTYLFGRNERTVQGLIDQYPFLKKADTSSFAKSKEVFLCLPPHAYEPFLSTYQTFFLQDVNFYHMATAISEKEVKELVKERNVIPLKLAGHAAVVKKEKRGLFVVPQMWKDEGEQIKKWFPTMKFVAAREEEVLKANQLGTEAAVAMVLQLQSALAENKINQEIVKYTLSQTVPGVIEAYQTNDLGGFARKVVEQLKQKGEGNENR